MESDREQPEMEFAQSFVEHPSRNLRIPIVKCAKERKEYSANDYVVKMRHDEIRAAELPVERRRAQHDASETRDQKLEQESDTEQHRRLELNPPAPHRSQPVEDFDSGG